MSALVACALYAVVVALTLHALLDCVRTPSSRVRFLPKTLWVLFLLSAPVLGGLAWRYLGARPVAQEPSGARNDSGAQGFAQV
ncbi:MULTISPECIES: PLDc N-terminal domain-containing protein [Streptomyces]|uniref:PLDc N-terminal domain-containing protein n=1 Tax=Streptomyces gilvifuscus TaxID=1550617 RepID=A0ABT5FR03_9ACTN|nr:PLDc N-terminal domain-containing protein [Streptomyces gilvifuscus]MDC2954905.1 PLDc N-terminal domain-containing protein [Streptomyces gilvifuscus]